MRGAVRLIWALLLACVGLPGQIDPAAWGADHVGRAAPDYIDGEECLFCHRREIGALWPQNPHAHSLRTEGDDRFRLGARELRLGRPGVLEVRTNAGWDGERFGDHCAGCHASGVDPQSKLFWSVGIDCYACHGEAPLEHTGDTSRVLFSKQRPGEAREIVSVCGQCHLRGGRSRATGRPYATNFVAGDNLFRDFEVDWSRADDPALDPGERHIWFSARQVAVEGEERLTCLRCHDVHQASAAGHRRVLRNAVCWTCHQETEKLGTPAAWERHSAVCEY